MGSSDGLVIHWVDKLLFASDKLRKHLTGSRSTFEFPSWINLSGPSLFRIARTLGK